MVYTLETPAGDADWQAFHAIREAELFVARGRIGIYDRDHPDDRNPAHYPLLLKLDGRPLGVVRLDDFGDGTGAVRLFAIVAAEQGQGHGRALNGLVEARARDAGLHTLYLNAVSSAVGFYEGLGWKHYEWNRSELAELAEDCIQMRKAIG